MTTERETWAMTLDVTQDIIDRSTCGSATDCAVAEAIKAEVRGASRVSVDLCVLTFTNADGQWIARTTAHVRQFIADFDRGKENVRPTKFEVTFRKY